MGFILEVFLGLMLGSNGIGESLGGSRAAKMRVKNEGLFSAGLLQGPGGGWGTSEEGPPPTDP